MKWDEQSAQLMNKSRKQIIGHLTSLNFSWQSSTNYDMCDKRFNVESRIYNQCRFIIEILIY